MSDKYAQTPLQFFYDYQFPWQFTIMPNFFQKFIYFENGSPDILVSYFKHHESKISNERLTNWMLLWLPGMSRKPCRCFFFEKKIEKESCFDSSQNLSNNSFEWSEFVFDVKFDDFSHQEALERFLSSKLIFSYFVIFHEISRFFAV